MMKTLTTSAAAIAIAFVAASASTSFADDYDVEIKGSYVYQHAYLKDVKVKGEDSELTVNTIKNAKIKNSKVYQYAYLHGVKVTKGGTLEVNSIGEAE